MLNKRDKQRLEAAQTETCKASDRIYKIRQSKKCQYKGTIENTKRSRRNSNILDELKRTRRKDARGETAKNST
jgi:hypothetical protein